MACSKELLFKINNIYVELNKNILICMRRCSDQNCRENREKERERVITNRVVNKQWFPYNYSGEYYN